VPESTENTPPTVRSAMRPGSGAMGSTFCAAHSSCTARIAASRVAETSPSTRAHSCGLGSSVSTFQAWIRAEGRLEGLVVGLEQHVEGTGPVGLARGHPALPEIALDAAVQQHAEQSPFVQHADEAARRPACGEGALGDSLAAPGQFGEGSSRSCSAGVGAGAACGVTWGGTRHGHRGHAARPRRARRRAGFERVADHAERGPEFGVHGGLFLNGYVFRHKTLQHRGF
jgi:hypothetical protein